MSEQNCGCIGPDTESRGRCSFEPDAGVDIFYMLPVHPGTMAPTTTAVILAVSESCFGAAGTAGR